MSVIPFDSFAKPDSRAPSRHGFWSDGFWSDGFWRGLALALDRLASYPTHHALSDSELRRVADDIERCRRLMRSKPERHTAKLSRVRRKHAARPVG
jgi:hypothetical protein